MSLIRKSQQPSEKWWIATGGIDAWFTQSHTTSIGTYSLTYHPKEQSLTIQRRISKGRLTDTFIRPARYYLPLLLIEVSTSLTTTAESLSCVRCLSLRWGTSRFQRSSIPREANFGTPSKRFGR